MLAILKTTFFCLHNFFVSFHNRLFSFQFNFKSKTEIVSSSRWATRKWITFSDWMFSVSVSNRFRCRYRFRFRFRSRFRFQSRLRYMLRYRQLRYRLRYRLMYCLRYWFRYRFQCGYRFCVGLDFYFGFGVFKNFSFDLCFGFCFVVCPRLVISVSESWRLLVSVWVCSRC